MSKPRSSLSRTYAMSAAKYVYVPSSERRTTRSLSSPKPRRRRPDRAVLLVRLESRRARSGRRCLDRALAAPRVEVDAEPLERRLDRLAASRRPGRLALEVAEVVAVVAVLGRRLPAPHRLDRRAELVHLRAGVVVVVLALDLVPAASSRRATASPYAPFRADGDRDRAGRVRGDHLDLDALARSSPPGPPASDRLERRDEPLVAEEDVDEARARRPRRARRRRAPSRRRRSPPRSRAADGAACPRAAARRSSRSRRARRPRAARARAPRRRPRRARRQAR